MGFSEHIDTILNSTEQDCDQLYCLTGQNACECACGLSVGGDVYDFMSASVCGGVCACVSFVRIIECFRGSAVRCIEPVLFRELRRTRNLYYY